MILRDVLLLIIAVTLITLLPTMLQTNRKLRFTNRERATLAAGVLLFQMLASLFARSRGFGVDTLAYTELFEDYCRAQPTKELDLSYQFTLFLINAVMLGACNATWLICAWTFIISALLFCLPVPWQIRLRYAALLLFSLIGIELTSNALRQGLSVVVCILCVAVWRYHKIGALLLALLATVLHSSTILVFVALALSILSWRWFWLCFLAIISSVVYFMQSGIEPLLVRPLLFEIQKYMSHEPDEVWVRILALSSVFGALTAPLFSAYQGCSNKIINSRAYAIAFRIGICSLPLLGLPYFGYRIIYGLYPLILYFTLLTDPLATVKVGKHFFLVFFFNAVLLLIWAQGSSQMRDVPFFN